MTILFALIVAAGILAFAFGLQWFFGRPRKHVSDIQVSTEKSVNPMVKFAWLYALFVLIFGRLVIVQDESFKYILGASFAGLTLAVVASPMFWGISRLFSKKKWTWFHWLNVICFTALIVQLIITFIGPSIQRAVEERVAFNSNKSSITQQNSTPIPAQRNAAASQPVQPAQAVLQQPIAPVPAATQAPLQALPYASPPIDSSTAPRVGVCFRIGTGTVVLVNDGHEADTGLNSAIIIQQNGGRTVGSWIMEPTSTRVGVSALINGQRSFQWFDMPVDWHLNLDRWSCTY